MFITHILVDTEFIPPLDLNLDILKGPPRLNPVVPDESSTIMADFAIEVAKCFDIKYKGMTDIYIYIYIISVFLALLVSCSLFFYLFLIIFIVPFLVSFVYFHKAPFEDTSYISEPCFPDSEDEETFLFDLKQ